MGEENKQQKMVSENTPFFSRSTTKSNFKIVENKPHHPTIQADVKTMLGYSSTIESKKD